ncbi:hypothetical protein IAD21_04360 [Abditibacteriota bacterium]|nr:hypothetical protein IAD21_04360 [Abditibacteriota bacterium]
MNQSEREAQLREVVAWDAKAIGELASLSRLRVWSFAPNSTFEPGILGELVRLPKLQYLSFQGSKLESENLRSLAKLASLRSLNLKECRFGADDFNFLCEQFANGTCPKLQEIYLDGASIGEEELRALGKVERLCGLNLSNNAISDAGLEHLSGLKKLETLCVQNTRVTEAGVLRLAVLPHLSTIILGNQKDSEKICQKLFLAQVALQKSNVPLDSAQLQAAEEQLRGFLAEMERWELDTGTRLGELVRSHKTVGDFNRAIKKLNIEVGARRAAIVARYCSRKLQTPIVIYDNLSGLVSNLPQFRGSVEWIDTETPTRKKTYFYAEGFVHMVIKRRYTLIFEGGEWKLDKVQYWKGGWRRETF